MIDEGNVSLYCIKSKIANAISLPRRFYQQPFAVFKLGKMEIEVRCFPNNTSDKVGLAENLFKKCGIVDGFTCNLEADGRILRLGPVIGIFVSKRYIQQLVKEQKPSFRSIETNKANIQAKTLIYHFSSDDIRLSDERVAGTWFNPRSRKWEQSNFPLMDVLFDKISGRVVRNSKRHAAIRNLFRQRSILLFNAQHYFDKWDLHQKLSRYESMRPHLPKTRLFHFQGLKEMLNENPVVYLKASVGSMGQQVMQIKKRSDGRYEYSYFRKKLERGVIKTFSGLKRIIQPFFGKDLLLMQHGIRSVKFDGRNVDMRATVQRNETGKIEINSIAVRMGLKDSPITSTRSGSKVLRLGDFFQTFGKYLPRHVSRDQINQFLIKVYRSIESSYGAFGEMGIDFTIDKQGRLYLIESNAKPAKDSLYKSFDQKTILQSFLTPLKYAKYLAKTISASPQVTGRNAARMSRAKRSKVHHRANNRRIIGQNRSR